MEWNILLVAEFEEWFLALDSEVRVAIAAHIRVLQQFGPSLGRPHVDTIKRSTRPSLKELRVQHQGKPWRILFVFDPRRQAILLVGGNKQGNKRWYKEAIPLAEQRYQCYLTDLENTHDEKLQ